MNGADLSNGLLSIDLVREILEALKPRKISIQTEPTLVSSGASAQIEAQKRLDPHYRLNRAPSRRVHPSTFRVGKERAMKPDMFKQPVSILVGLGFPAEVRS